VRKGRERDPIAICKAVLVKKGFLSQDEADKYSPEGRHATEVTNEDFPPDVVEYLTEGINSALAAPMPPAEEGGMWVFKENA
jgi:hypothetical protein